MASIKNSFTAFLAVFLLASGVEAQSTLTLSTCDDNSALEDGKRGSSLRTYEILCDKDADGTAITNIVTKTGATFETFCALLESGPWTLSTGEVLDLIDFIGEGVNEHTIFAPTDAAFAEIQSLVDAALDLETTNPSAFDNIVPYWLQLHILPDTYLASDFTCDDTYDTLNLSGRATGSQKQKNKMQRPSQYFHTNRGRQCGKHRSTHCWTTGRHLPDSVFRQRK